MHTEYANAVRSQLKKMISLILPVESECMYLESAVGCSVVRKLEFLGNPDHFGLFRCFEPSER